MDVRFALRGFLIGRGRPLRPRKLINILGVRLMNQVMNFDGSLWEDGDFVSAGCLFNHPGLALQRLHLQPLDADTLCSCATNLAAVSDF